jgi:hypothetical protein
VNTELALKFLQAHQPMPPDSELSEKLLEAYNDVRKHFIANPDVRCIGLLLHSFGDGSGFGLYQIVDDVLQVHPYNDVISELALALKDQRYSIRLWSADIAASFPDPSLVQPLSDLVQENDVDIRSAAVNALFDIQDGHVDVILAKAAKQETDSELRERILDAIEYRKTLL